MTDELVAVFIPAGRDERRWLDECARYCDRRRLRVLTFTHDAATAARLVVLEQVDRVVVARPWHAEQLALQVDVVSDPPDRPAAGDPDRAQRLSNRRTSRTSRPRWRR